MNHKERCQQYGVQACCFCEDITCGDNTTGYAVLYRSKLAEITALRARVAELEASA